MPRVGPEGGSCFTTQFIDRTFPDRAFIYRDDERVELVVLVSKEDGITQMGLKEDDVGK